MLPVATLPSDSPICRSKAVTLPCRAACCLGFHRFYLSALTHAYTRRRTSHLSAHFTRPNTVFHITRTRTKIAFAKLCIATLANYHYTISVATSTCICMPGCPVSHAWSPTQTVNIRIDQAGFNGQKLSVSPLHKPLHYSTAEPQWSNVRAIISFCRAEMLHHGQTEIYNSPYITPLWFQAF